MWLSKPSALCAVGISIFATLGLSACTVEPLNGARNTTSSLSGQPSASVASILARTEVDAVTTRTAQQVRNHLLFAMNGGKLQPNGRYSVELKVTGRNSNLSITNSSLAPTSARITLLANYILRDKQTKRIIATGKRRTIAAYDRTNQSFANERAQRDAQNRAAKEAAQLIRLAVAQDIAKL